MTFSASLLDGYDNVTFTIAITNNLVVPGWLQESSLVDAVWASPR